MTSSIKKECVRVVMTPAIEINVHSNDFIIKFTGNKYIKLQNAFYDATGDVCALKIRVHLISVTGVEFRDRHIYLYRAGADTYLDLDFSLVPYMMESVKKIFHIDLAVRGHSIYYDYVKDANDDANDDNSDEDNKIFDERWRKFITKIKFVCQ